MYAYSSPSQQWSAQKEFQLHHSSGYYSLPTMKMSRKMCLFKHITDVWYKQLNYASVVATYICTFHNVYGIKMHVAEKMNSANTVRTSLWS